MEGWRGYWSRRGYQRLKGSGGRRRKRAELGVGERGRRRFWRMKVGPKIRIPRIPSPKKLVVWVRDAYVRMMMGVAKSGLRGMSGAAYGYGGFGGAPTAVKEYDDKMIVHIYNSLVMARGGLVPHRALPPSLPISSL